MKQMPPHGGDEVFQRWRLLLTSFREERMMSEENSVGAQPPPANPAVLPDGSPLPVPTTRPVDDGAAAALG